ncbi:MBL fold metallo-hydrolase [Bradyrhizobium jicamae]|uniref:MBL fold metallo-hydrolase n=1 Tax=Bradyrhizobium jicamae TaxID=280332 RepID=UPI001BABA35B|nr:MBL fold metallo-hydrolase [Bradyrhizobium jicamae]MBR0757102.1 MBL fold metallo-hydrolase [Bradyrhizobium jicamae]
MELRVFHSDKGDCLLIKGSGGGKILSDGGMRESFVNHVAAHLAEEDAIDLLCVSHVDDDHIGGVLELLDNAMAWKVFRHHQASGDNEFNEPDVPEPPKIKRIWHNAFHDQIGQNAGEISDMLAAMVPILADVDDDQLRDAALENQAIVSSNKQAIKVSQRVSAEQLDIPLNENQKLIMFRSNNATVAFGSLKCRIVAPFEEDLDAFRDVWNDWLRDNRETVRKLRDQARRDAGELEENVDTILGPAFAATQLGDRTKVTPPNLASIMLYVEDGNTTLLLTGDGHANDVIKGLDKLGLLENGKLHVDILKVPHHGSEKNTTKEFARNITADNYVFCGNGFSGNPEPIVLDAIFNARSNDGTNRKFKFWFNSSKESETKQDRLKHMKAIEDKVRTLRDQDNRLQFFFLGEADFFDFTP